MIRAEISRLATWRNLHLLLLLAMGVSLPLSKYVASAAQILLAVAWLAEGRFPEKWARLKQKPQIFLFTLLFLVPLAGLIHTADLKYGLGDLKVKLPLLMLPLILGSIRPLDRKEMRLILGGFIAAVLIGAAISLSIMLGIGPARYTGDRESILFISHIRFALMADLAIFLLVYYLTLTKPTPARVLVLAPLAAGLTAYLFLLKSLTGVVILTSGLWILLLIWTVRQKDLIVRWFAVVGLATAPLLVLFYLNAQVRNFYTIRDDAGSLDRVTLRGNPYWHDLDNKMIENGYHVGFYLCETEMREAWNALGGLDYDGPDRKGQELKYTLMRYLTSLGLRKDAHGVSQLGKEDIRLVEEGYSNHIYRHPGRFSVRIYQTIWEIDQARKGGNPAGHSVTQRLEYLKTGWAIFRDHPVFGVGTGDIGSAFDRKYDELRSPLPPEWRLRAHNQFLTFLIGSGIVGFILLMVAIVLPVVLSRGLNPVLVSLFLLVALLSMLNEDTLETQAGVAFFTLFYCLFIFADGSRKVVAEERSRDGNI